LNLIPASLTLVLFMLVYAAAVPSAASQVVPTGGSCSKDGACSMSFVNVGSRDGWVSYPTHASVPAGGSATIYFQMAAPPSGNVVKMNYTVSGLGFHDRWVWVAVG
jgi:hypothetical protein